MPWMKNIIARIKKGRGSSEDIDTLLDICDNIEGKTVCPFGEAGAWPIRAFINKFKEDFEKHIN